MFTSPEPEPSSARKSQFFRARAELSSEIQNYFEPEPSQARIFTLSPSRAEPAQLELFGSSQLELEPARYTLDLDDVGVLCWCSACVVQTRFIKACCSRGSLQVALLYLMMWL